MKNVQRLPLGRLSTGEAVTGYCLSNAAGMRVLISDFGGRIWQLYAPDRNGNFADVICGYDGVDGHEHGDGYLGALIGRWANRICGTMLTVDGVQYPIYANNNGNHLHGGRVGFDHRFWRVRPKGGDEPQLVLSLISPDGEEGYPGTLRVTVTYTLRRDNALVIRYQAVTDKKTVVNLTNHAYFNLGGFASGDIFDHVLELDVTDYLETDGGLIPTGKRIPVEGTPFDFRRAKTIGQDFSTDGRCPALQLAGGYDHCLTFAEATAAGEPIPYRGYLAHPVSGRRMNLYTNQPCVQLYTANFLTDDGCLLKGGMVKRPNIAVCLETQRMPDGMNHAGFISPYLDVGERYDYTTVYQFSVTQ